MKRLLLFTALAASLWGQQSSPALSIGKTGEAPPDFGGCVNYVNIGSIYIQANDPTILYSGPFICVQTGNPRLGFSAYTWQKFCLTPLNNCGGGGGDNITSPLMTINVGGTPTNTTVDVVPMFRECYIIIGADNGPSLGTADIAPQGNQCFIPKNSTIIEIDVAADTGTPAVVVAKNHQGTITDLSASLPTAASGGVACANVSGTCISGVAQTTALLSTTLAAGDYIQTHTSATASTAHRMSIAVTYTY